MAVVYLGGVTAYTVPPPPIARVFLGGIRAIQPVTPAPAGARVYLGGVSAAQPEPEQLLRIRYQGAWHECDVFLRIADQWVPAPGNGP